MGFNLANAETWERCVFSHEKNAVFLYHIKKMMKKLRLLLEPI